LTVFDFPVPSLVVGRRESSNVPAQALALLNDPYVIEQARVWAESTLAQPGDDVERVGRLFLSAFARRPSATELEHALAFLQQQRRRDECAPADRRAWADLCHMLLNTKEFIYIR
jgi:hypothetical protein